MTRRAWLTLSTVALGVAPALAGGPAWRQWGGPNGDFAANSVRLSVDWPDDGPKELWRRDLSGGHSGIVVADGVLYTMTRGTSEDIVLALKTSDGSEIWKTSYAAPVQEGQRTDFGEGPHSTPLVAGPHLFTVSSTAILTALDRESGKIVWSHDLMAEHGASHLGRGFGSSPIAWRDMVIVNVGGKDIGIAAFDQKTGEIRWKSAPRGGAYPTPVIATIGGQSQLICAAGLNRFALDPTSGEELWQLTLEKPADSLMSTPIAVGDDTIMYSAAYGSGSRAIKVNRVDGEWTAEVLWHTRRMRVQHGTMTTQGDMVYGSSGDFGPALLCAMNVKTGKLAWRDRRFAKSTLLRVGKRLIILDETGLLAIGTPNDEGIKIHSQAQLLEGKAWTVPTLVGTTLYVRDYHTLIALDLRPPTTQP